MRRTFARCWCAVRGTRPGRDGSRTIEAEHVLLALAASRTTPAARMLAEAGLTEDAIRAALDREWEQSLAVAGIAVTDRAVAHGNT